MINNVKTQQNAISYEGSGALRTTAAIATGTVAYTVTPYFINKPIINLIQNNCNKYSHNRFYNEKISQKAKNALKDTKLPHIRIINFTKDMARKNMNIIKGTPFGYIQKEIIIQTRKGQNAIYSDAAKTIVCNTQRGSVFLFHEIGHAINANTRGIGKILSRLRLPCAQVALLTALLKRKKGEGESCNGNLDRATTFVKENCGKIALLGTIPTLAEEGLASIKGLKLAKKYLAPKDIKGLKKAYLKAFSTYGIASAIIGLSVVIASTVRDKIAPPIPKEEKIEM